jgi:hypothetical protein
MINIKKYRVNAIEIEKKKQRLIKVFHVKIFKKSKNIL